MPQTFLALLAIVCVSLLVLQMGQGRVRDSTAIYRSDAIVQARGVAVSVLERLSAYPFDGGEGATPLGSGTNAYSPRGSFGTGGTAVGLDADALLASPSRDDLDDFDGVAGAVARQSVTDAETGATQEVTFEVSITVDYAARDGAGHWRPVTDPSIRTHYKLATVFIDHETFPGPLRFGRIYAAP